MLSSNFANIIFCVTELNWLKSELKTKTLKTLKAKYLFEVCFFNCVMRCQIVGIKACHCLTKSSSKNLRGHAYFNNFFLPVPSILVSLLWRRENNEYDEKHGKTRNNNNIKTKRQAPWNFQKVCTILYMFITSLNPSKMGLLESWDCKELREWEN